MAVNKNVGRKRTGLYMEQFQLCKRINRNISTRASGKKKEKTTFTSSTALSSNSAIAASKNPTEKSN